MKTQINILNVTNISDLFNFSVVKYIAFDIEKCRAFFSFGKNLPRIILSKTILPSLFLISSVACRTLFCCVFQPSKGKREASVGRETRAMGKCDFFSLPSPVVRVSCSTHVSHSLSLTPRMRRITPVLPAVSFHEELY